MRAAAGTGRTRVCGASAPGALTPAESFRESPSPVPGSGRASVYETVKLPNIVLSCGVQ